jgi:hypothetical protein
LLLLLLLLLLCLHSISKASPLMPLGRHRGTGIPWNGANHEILLFLNNPVSNWIVNAFLMYKIYTGPAIGDMQIEISGQNISLK